MMFSGALILCTLFAIWLVESKESREVRSIEAVRIAEIKAEARAKNPVKVYDVEKLGNGNYSIKEFHPKR